MTPVWTLSPAQQPLGAVASSQWDAATVERALEELGDRTDAEAVEQRALLLTLRGKSSRDAAPTKS